MNEFYSPAPSGLGGMSDSGGLHGAHWIRGSKGDGEQMVPGSKGILGKLNDGMEAARCSLLVEHSR